jgi:hypothetical protein
LERNQCASLLSQRRRRPWAVKSPLKPSAFFHTQKKIVQTRQPALGWFKNKKRGFLFCGERAKNTFQTRWHERLLLAAPTTAMHWHRIGTASPVCHGSCMQGSARSPICLDLDFKAHPGNWTWTCLKSKSNSVSDFGLDLDLEVQFFVGLWFGLGLRSPTRIGLGLGLGLRGPTRIGLELGLVLRGLDFGLGFGLDFGLDFGS